MSAVETLDRLERVDEERERLHQKVVDNYRREREALDEQVRQLEVERLHRSLLVVLIDWLRAHIRRSDAV